MNQGSSLIRIPLIYFADTFLFLILPFSIGGLMRPFRRRYILFRYSGKVQEPRLISHLRDKLQVRYAKVVYRKAPFMILRVDHLSWESIKRANGPDLRIFFDTFGVESIVASGTIRKLKEKIKALEGISSYGDEEAVPVKSEGKDVE